MPWYWVFFLRGSVRLAWESSCLGWSRALNYALAAVEEWGMWHLMPQPIILLSIHWPATHVLPIIPGTSNNISGVSEFWIFLRFLLRVSTRNVAEMDRGYINGAVRLWCHPQRYVIDSGTLVTWNRRRDQSTSLSVDLLRFTVDL